MKKNRYCQIRLSQDEYDSIGKRTSEAGLTRSEFLRRVALGQKLSKISIDTEPLRRISIELSRQGNNLNQIARVLHQRGFDERDLPSITSTVKKASAIITEISELLGIIRGDTS